MEKQIAKTQKQIKKHMNPKTLKAKSTRTWQNYENL